LQFDDNNEDDIPERSASMVVQQKKKSSLFSKIKTFIGKTPKNSDMKD